MNRKGFLVRLAALAALPIVAKLPVEEVAPIAVDQCTAGGNIVGVLTTLKNESIVDACERIRKEAEMIAGRNYAFHLRRNHGALDFITQNNDDQ